MDASIFRVIVPAKEIESAVAFYAALFDAPGERVSPHRHYFECGPVILAVVDPSADRIPFRANPDWLYLSVQDLDEALSRSLAAGATLETPIADYPWGERSFYVRDTSGNPICFVQATTLFTGGRFIP